MSQRFRTVLAASAGLAALLAAAPAAAASQGLLDYLFRPQSAASCGSCAAQPAPVVETEYQRAAPCASCRPAPGYRGDYMVDQGPVYSGPAVIAPQPTYAPSPTASGYPYVSAQSETEAYSNEMAQYQAAPRARVYRRAPPHRAAIKRHAPVRRTVNVRNNLPAPKGTQVIHARAEVRIYGNQRMDIRLYRK